MPTFIKIIYVILFLALAFQPHFSRHIGAVPKPYIESLVTVIIVAIAYLIFHLHRRQIHKQVDQIKVYDKRVSELQHQAFYDPLTGLPNRLLLKDRIVTAISSAKRYNQQVAILFLDLDRFKIINDTFGHKVGDLLLQEVGKRLQRHVREIDTVTRLGGDEFVVVLNEQNSPEGVIKVVESIMETLNRSYLIEGLEIATSASIGITVYPQHGQDQDLLLKRADETLYKVKKQGGKNYQFYNIIL